MKIRIHLVEADGRAYDIEGKPGQSLMKAALAGSVDGIAADCGGCCTCATCHVIVDEAWRAKLPPTSDDEEAMLDMAAHPREPGSRLACQIALKPELDGLQARLPPTQY